MIIARTKNCPGEGALTIQTLREHSNSVAEMTRARAEVIGLPTIGYLTGLLHDAGKAKPAFQRYICMPEDKRAALRGTVVHSRAGALLARDLAASAGEDCIVSAIAEQLMMMVIEGHHEGMMDAYDDAGIYLPERAVEQYRAEDREAIHLFLEDLELSMLDLAALFKTACKELAVALKTATSELSERYRPFYDLASKPPSDVRSVVEQGCLAMLGKYLTSCLVDADRYDAMVWGEAAQGREMPRTPAEKGVEWGQLLNVLEQHLALRASDTEMGQLRAALSRRCKAAGAWERGIYQCWAPTGFGKTLSSLRFALEHARTHGMRRIIYVIPYTSIIDQTAKVMHEIYDELEDPELILEHHSAVVMDENDVDGVGPAEWKLATERWDSPIILTTMVQLLNTCLKDNNTNTRRLQALANSVIICDEIQTLPYRCSYLFFLCANFLRACCNSSIVLCSATQPTYSRMPFPLLYTGEGDIGGITAAEQARAQRTRIDTSMLELGRMAANTLADKVVACGARSTLVVHNTKRAARQTYLAIRERAGEIADVYYLSTDLCPAHRLALLDKIKGSLAVKSERPVYIVSTQLIEAGVDLSVDCGWRSFAGLDTLIQFSGRINRHGEVTGQSPVYVFESEDEDKVPDSIRLAQSVFRAFLFDYQRMCARYPEKRLALESPVCIARYYKALLREHERVAAYPLPRQDAAVASCGRHYDTLLMGLCRGRRGAGLHPITAAYRTVGEACKVIDEDTVSVIVPYDERATALISDVTDRSFAWLPVGEQRRKVRALQQYTVSVYRSKVPSYAHNLTLWQSETYIADEDIYDAGPLGLGFGHQNTERSWII